MACVTEFLVAYDYGMGGLWALVAAPTAAAILSAYPEVEVVDERPPWLDDDEYAKLDHLRLDDEDPQGLLRVVIADRGRR